MNIAVIIAAYWLLAIATCYTVRHINGKREKNKAMRSLIGEKPMKKKVVEHVSIWLLMPLCVPLLPIVFFPYGKVFGKRKRGPRPVPKKFRAAIKRDRVFDEDGECMSISDYNIKHGTEYTLDDVYGKGYYESLPEEERNHIEEERKRSRFEIQECLPDSPHLQAAERLGRGLLDEDLTSFSEMLSDDVELLFYEKDPIYGKDEVVDYWNSYAKRYITNCIIKTLKVKQCNYYVKPCLEMDTMYVLFRFDDSGKIVMIFLTPRNTDKYNLSGSIQLDELPFSMEFLKRTGFVDLPGTDTDFHNRIPCMRCGEHSENLEWHGLEKGIIIGAQSVCPHCGAAVEFLPVIRVHREPVSDTGNDEDIPF